MIVVHFVIIVSTFVIANVSDPKLDSEGWIDLRVIAHILTQKTHILTDTEKESAGDIFQNPALQR